MVWTVLGGSLVAVIALLVTPWGTAVNSWVEDFFDLGGTKVKVAAIPLLDLCDQGWAFPPERHAAISAEFENSRNGIPISIEKLKRNDAAAAGKFTLDIDISTNAAEKAVLHDIRVRVTGRKDKTNMEPFAARCGGRGVYHSFAVPLHELPVGRSVSVREMYKKWPRQVALPEGAMGGDEPDIFGAERARRLQLPLTMANDDPETLRILAIAEHGYHEWELELVVAVAGEKRETYKVDFEGDPFRTVAQVLEGD